MVCLLPLLLLSATLLQHLPYLRALMLQVQDGRAGSVFGFKTKTETAIFGENRTETET